MTPLLPLSQQGRILSLLLIFMATCYHMNCIWRLTKQLLISTSLLPTLLNVKVPAIQGTIVAPIRATATLISLVAGGVAVVEDHLINIPFLTRPNALHVKVCHKLGHTAATCWFRFEQGYQSESSPLNANLPSLPTASDSQWYHDTRSNVHLTNELANLNMHAENYNGTDQIRVGNGQGLHISNFGRGLLPTPSRNFHLFSLFHVPQI